VWQYADYFEGQRERGFQRLLVSLKRRADGLALKFEEPAAPPNKITLSNGMEFMHVPAGKFLMGSAEENKRAYPDEHPQHSVDIPYDYWMARCIVTNELYNVYVKVKGIKHPVDFWGSGWEKKKDHPVTYVVWTDVMQHCKWLNSLYKNELPLGLILRLPTEAEWEKAARGTDGREFPWGNEFDKNKCNSSEGGERGPTPVGFYSPRGDSLYGCADMAGNVWEWMHSLMKEYPYKVNDGREDEKTSGKRVLRGGSFIYDKMYARCAFRGTNDFIDFGNNISFRVVAAPELS
jgi:formylglycine-generating enzyme required for sulfatase activity